MPVPSTISVIVITYKRPDELSGVLDNILNQRRQPDEIIVLDNDPDQSGRKAQHLDEPLVRYVCPGMNLGPAEGRNRAARIARGDVLIFIDDDCRFEHFNATSLVPEYFGLPEVGCLAFLIRNAVSHEIVPREYPGFKTDRWSDPHDVSYFLGGGFAILRSLFEELGGFDEVLFHGEEEVELSFRIIKAAKRIYYVPDVAVLHREATAGREPIKRNYRLIRNRVYLALKHLPFPYLLTHLVVWGGFAFWQALLAKQPGEYFRGLASLKCDGLCAKALEYRRANPMQKETIAYLAKHEGRLIY